MRGWIVASCLFVAVASGCGEGGGPSDKASTAAPSGVACEILLEKVPQVPPTPVALVEEPDAKGFFILGRDGDLFHYDRPLSSFEVTKLGVAPRVTAFHGRTTRNKIDGSFAWGDMGTLGLALDPEYSSNRFLYVWYCDKSGMENRLDRFTWSRDQGGFEKSRANVLRFSRRDPPAPYHMGGVLQFLPDRTLLVATGDAERPELSQDKMDLNGKLLRIKPRHGPEGGYDVPSDNPHVTQEGWRPEIVCVGLRAPFRAFLRPNGHLWFGDVGAVYEEVNVWRGGADDFGWGHGPITDGPQAPASSVAPLVVWTQERDFSAEDPDYNGETRLSAGVGVVYEPGGTDRYRGLLTGKLIFFEILRGWIRAGAVADDGRLDAHAHIGHRQFMSQMIRGADGYVYGVTWARPESLFRLRAADEISPPPRQDPMKTDEPAMPPGAERRPRGH